MKNIFKESYIEENYEEYIEDLLESEQEIEEVKSFLKEKIYLSTNY